MNMEVISVKGCAILPRSPEHESHHQMRFTVMPRTSSFERESYLKHLFNLYIGPKRVLSLRVNMGGMANMEDWTLHRIEGLSPSDTQHLPALEPHHRIHHTSQCWHLIVGYTTPPSAGTSPTDTPRLLALEPHHRMHHTSQRWNLIIEYTTPPSAGTSAVDTPHLPVLAPHHWIHYTSQHWHLTIGCTTLPSAGTSALNIPHLPALAPHHWIHHTS